MEYQNSGPSGTLTLKRNKADRKPKTQSKPSEKLM